MPDFDGALDFQRFAADWTGLAGCDNAQVGPRVTLMSRSIANVAKMEAILVGAGGHAAGAAEAFVGDNRELSTLTAQDCPDARQAR